ncbi:hypothetical protein MNBD_NITROSPINAE01-608 [hydrothermal vent metagenome]|uniref:Type cbb3 cytochrome oxidase biogenesis protein CcoS, involved in heme b insertion n=1 Tax=hydrothermal vent metagenome TaxID=652676 RepID=A0A3B1CPA7_9ZZZZ
MDVIYGILPLMIVVGFAMVMVLVWAIKSGQFEDMEGPATRIIMDDDDPMLPKPNKKKKD